MIVVYAVYDLKTGTIHRVVECRDISLITPQAPNSPDLGYINVSGVPELRENPGQWRINASKQPEKKTELRWSADPNPLKYQQEGVIRISPISDEPATVRAITSSGQSMTVEVSLEDSDIEIVPESIGTMRLFLESHPNYYAEPFDVIVDP